MIHKTHTRSAVLFFGMMIFLSACIHRENEALVQMQAKIVDIGFGTMHGSDNKIIAIGTATLLVTEPNDYKELKIDVSLIDRVDPIPEEQNPFVIGNIIQFKMRLSKIKDTRNINEFDLIDLSVVQKASR